MRSMAYGRVSPKRPARNRPHISRNSTSSSVPASARSGRSSGSTKDCWPRGDSVTANRNAPPPRHGSGCQTARLETVVGAWAGPARQ